MATRAEARRAVERYIGRMRAAIEAGHHHDQRRAILQDLLRDGFGLTVDEVELEHNVKVEHTRGRIDLLYGSLIWEVKRDLARERVDLERELRLYLAELGERAFGIGTDGLAFEAYQLDGGGQLRRIDAYDLDAPTASADEALDWLDGYVFAVEEVLPTSEAIVARFGPNSAVFRTAELELREMWDRVREDSSASVKHDEWERLLEVVYGTQVGSDELWIRHTYLVMVARLITYLVIVEHLPAQGTELGALTGELFVPLGLPNLVERDFFAWLSVPELAESARRLLRGLSQHLALFAIQDIDEDLLKELYEEMVDPREREWLGEFYTPDWLADLTLERAGFDAETRMLDPGCGSGTFLFAAIRRLRQSGLRGAELVRRAERNIVGLDIHPLAVTIARVNYVLALRSDIREAREALHIPVFMADTLAAPEAGFGRMVEIAAPVDGLPPMAPPLPQRFQLPTEGDPEQTASLAQIVELVDLLSDPDLNADDARTGLDARLDEWGVRSYREVWHANLRLLRALYTHHRDTIWGFRLTNAARPHEIAAAPVDLVIGNPPWLTVMEMAGSEYRDRVRGIARTLALVGRGMGNIAHLDTSTVFAVFCAENFLPEGRGRVAFVFPRSVMAGARQHENFREGRIALWYRPVAAIDLDEVEPLFRIPACVMVFDKVAEAERPDPPWVWPTTTLRGVLPRKNASRVEADERLVEETAAPTAAGQASPYLPRALSGVDMRPRAFWIAEIDPDARVVDRRQPYLRSDSQAVADATRAWQGVSVRGAVEAHYLYATSLSVEPFRLGRFRLAVLPIEPDGAGGVRVLEQPQILARGEAGMAAWLGQAEREFRRVLERDDRQFARTVVAYLNTQQKLARQRPRAPRVVWGKGGTHVRAAVVPTEVQEVYDLPVQGFVVDLNQYTVVCESQEEAHYLSAMLNAAVVDREITPHQTRGQFGARDIHRRPVEFVPIPLFDAGPQHVELARLSMQAHEQAVDIAFSSQRNHDGYLAMLGNTMTRINELAEALIVERG